MTNRIRRLIGLQAAIFMLSLATVTGCRSYHVEITVENRTGAPAKLLEVDYPSASFGTDVVAPGTDYHYRIQVLGSGAVKVQYRTPDDTLRQIDGPNLSEHDQGTLQIVLLPDGKAQFTPQIVQPH